MIRYYCDICDREVKRNPVGTRVSGKGYGRDGNNPINIEIIAGVGDGWNSGIVCASCFRERVIDIIDTKLADGLAEVSR